MPLIYNSDYLCIDSFELAYLYIDPVSPRYYDINFFKPFQNATCNVCEGLSYLKDTLGQRCQKCHWGIYQLKFQIRDPAFFSSVNRNLNQVVFNPKSSVKGDLSFKGILGPLSIFPVVDSQYEHLDNAVIFESYSGSNNYYFKTSHMENRIFTPPFATKVGGHIVVITITEFTNLK